METNIFYVKEHKRSQSSVNGQELEKPENVYEKKRSKSNVSDKDIEKDDKRKKSTRKGKSKDDRQLTMKPLNCNHLKTP